MSGGFYDYRDGTLASEIFGWHIDQVGCLDGEKYDAAIKGVIKADPLQDKEISILVYDVFQLLHSYDWAVSGDTCIDDYKADVRKFKKKWFKTDSAERCSQIVKIATDDLREELLRTFGEAKDNG